VSLEVVRKRVGLIGGYQTFNKENPSWTSGPGNTIRGDWAQAIQVFGSGSGDVAEGGGEISCRWCTGDN